MHCPIFRRPFVKRFALSDRCPSCLPVTLVYCGQTVAWIIQDETRHAGRPRSWPHCVRWEPSSPSRKGHSPQFSAHTCCGQMAGWIKMPLGMEVDLSPGDFVLDGTQLPSPKKGQSPPIFGPFLLWPNGWMHQVATWYGGRPQPRRLCVRWGPSPRTQ